MVGKRTKTCAPGSHLEREGMSSFTMSPDSNLRLRLDWAETGRRPSEDDSSDARSEPDGCGRIQVVPAVKPCLSVMIHETEKENRGRNVLHHPKFVAPVADRCEGTEDKPEQGDVGADPGPVVEVAHEAPSISSRSEIVPVH